MIVDDDAHMQLALRQIVESAGHRVIEANSGQDAIELFEDFSPDLVITAAFVPQSNGIEMIRVIRRMTPAARIIAISGGCVGSGWNCLDSVVVSEANLALQKPFTCSQLLSAIDRALGGRMPVDPTHRNAPLPPAERRLRFPRQPRPSLAALLQSARGGGWMPRGTSAGSPRHKAGFDGPARRSPGNCRN